MTEKEKADAIRKARSIASDIWEYNKATITKGIEEDSFFDVIKELIEEGRDHYKKNVSPEIFRTTNYFDRAIVDVIIARRGNIRSKIW